MLNNKIVMDWIQSATSDLLFLNPDFYSGWPRQLIFPDYWPLNENPNLLLSCKAILVKNLYYVTDWAAGKVYAVNSDGTDYRTLIDLQKQGTADLEFIASERMVIIPMMQDNKLVAYRILE